MKSYLDIIEYFGVRNQMKKLNRAIHIDFHTPPGIYDFGCEFDGEEFAKTLQDAHVTHINMAAQCNFGYTYYKTKIGIPYPDMKGDMFKTIVDECHKQNIGLDAYDYRFFYRDLLNEVIK